jgi:hypothetical protein
VIRRGAYLIILATLMLLLVSLLVSTMGGSIRTTQAGHVGGNVSWPSPAQQGSPTPPPPALAVSLTEYQIGMPTSLSAGIHSFNVCNAPRILDTWLSEVMMSKRRARTWQFVADLPLNSRPEWYWS